MDHAMGANSAPQEPAQTGLRSDLRGGLARHCAEARALGRQAAPMVAAGMLNMSLSLTDTAMMGWLDPRALASGVVVSDTYSLLFYFAAGMVAAVGPLAAASLGAGDHRRAGFAIQQGLWLLLPLALLCAVAVGGSISFMGLLGVELPLRQPAEDYAAFMGATFAFMLVFAWGRAALSAIGRPQVPMYIMAAALPLNALGNYLLMYGALGLPEMGLAGAGASSLIVALFSAAAICLCLLAPALRPFRIFSGILRPKRDALARLAGVGLMMGVATLAETGVYLSSTIVMGLVATDALAAHALVFRILGLGYVMIVGLGQAVMIRIAGHAGAGRDEAEVQTRRTAQALSLLIAGLALALFLLARALVIRQAGTAAPETTEVLAAAGALLPLAGAALAMLALGNVSAAILRGRADVRVPAAIALGGYWGVGFASMAVAIGGFGWSAAGVWTGLALGSAAAAAGSAAYLARRNHGSARAQPRRGEFPSVAKDAMR